MFLCCFQLWCDVRTLMKQLRLYKDCLKTLTCDIEVDYEELFKDEKKMYSRFELWKYLEIATHTIKEWKHSFLLKVSESLLFYCFY